MNYSSAYGFCNAKQCEIINSSSLLRRTKILCSIFFTPFCMEYLKKKFDTIMRIVLVAANAFTKTRPNALQFTPDYRARGTRRQMPLSTRIKDDISYNLIPYLFRNSYFPRNGSKLKFSITSYGREKCEIVDYSLTVRRTEKLRTTFSTHFYLYMYFHQARD